MTRPLLKFLLHPCLLFDRAPVPQSTVWVKKLSGGAATLNNEATSLTGKKPALAIKEKAVPTKLSTPYSWPVGQKKNKNPSHVNVCYLYKPGKLAGGVKGATDLIWSFFAALKDSYQTK